MNSSRFPTQGDKEKILLIVHQDLVMLVVRMLPGLILFLTGLLLIFVLPPLAHLEAKVPFYYQGATVILLLGFLLVYFGWFLYYFNIIIATDERLVDLDQLGLFHKNLDFTEYGNIEDISVSQSGIFATVFNYGTLLVQTAGERQELTMNYVPAPYDLAKEIFRIRESLEPFEP